MLLVVKAVAVWNYWMSHSGSCNLNFVWFMNCQSLSSRFWKLITVNTKKIDFSTRKVLNVCYFYVLNVYLGGLLFTKFNVTENMQYCVSHFICSLISIYIYLSAQNLFMNQKLKKLINLVILTVDVYV